VQAVDIGEGDVGDLGMGAEVRPDMPTNEHLVMADRMGAQAWLRVLSDETVNQLGDGRRLALNLDVAEGIASLVD
jgi:hypothetical protein